MTDAAPSTRAATVGQLLIGGCLLIITIAFWRLHDGSDISTPGLTRVTEAIALSLAWLGGSALLLRRRRGTAKHETHDRGGLLVIHASQTGFAAELAERTATSLKAGGLAVDVRSIETISPADLTGATRALFVVSTTGEGDAPDVATAFQRGAMRTPLPLKGLRYGVLALGDRDYDDFCAFGRDLDRWLHVSGAAPLFDRVDVDNGDEGALRHWQHHVVQLSGTIDQPDWSRPAYRPWRLVERRLLNPGSVGGPCFHLALSPADTADLTWQAGDIAEIGPRRARGDETPLPHREYSIASVPGDGSLHLVVRQMRDADDRLGMGSGWLTQHAAIGDTVDLRVRRNASFHAPTDARPVLLIGNGTGIAGLRALIRARVARGHRRNWLVFGERHAGVDRLHVDEMERGLEAGDIERLDLVWSRESQGSRYVQDRVRAAAEHVRAFVVEGASIYVCGSLAGMAPGVDAVLREVLGDTALDDLAARGRYRRDVY